MPDEVCRPTEWAARLLALICICLLFGRLAEADEFAKADVVVVVDSSLSIHNPGLDPERTSLLVTRLLSDIVPGNLAVIRVLDLERDKELLPHSDTARTQKCGDSNATCTIVSPIGDWVQAVRSSLDRAGLLARPARGDIGYKQQLEQHLRQTSNNSLFGLSFETADSWLGQKKQPDVPQVLVWLSDGDPEDVGEMQTAISKLRANGVKLQTIIFGKGRTDIARQLGLNPQLVHNPGELMKAFADTFRVIVDAPYRLDDSVASNPSFDMKPLVSEAWVVVYGDETLGGVTVDSPDGPRTADYAQDHYHEPGQGASAGGYKVLYVQNPTAGRWTIHASGGGTGVAYAVIQRSNLYPVFLEPANAITGVPTKIIAGIADSKGGTARPRGALAAGQTLTAEWQDRVVALHDDGRDGDETAGDGRFTGPATFSLPGNIPVTIRLHGDLMDRKATGQVHVSSFFRYNGGPLTLRFGEIKAGNSSCLPVFLRAEQQGEALLKVRVKKGLPFGHSLVLRSDRGSSTPGKAGLLYQPGDRLELCLGTGPDAYTSEAKGEEYAEIQAEDSPGAAVYAYWKVDGVSWFQRNRKYIFGAIALLLIAIWIYGFIWPLSFPGRLALQYAAERDELDEQQSQPLASIRSVRKRWYRHARAYFHADYRVNRKPRGALVGFAATKRGVFISPESGNSLWRLNSEMEWAPVEEAGRRVSIGEIYRANDRGPFLRLEQKGAARR